MRSWTKTALALGGLIAVGLPAAAAAQPASTPPLDPTATLFCKGNDGDIAPMPYVTLGTIMRKYEARYRFGLTVQAKPMALTFSNPAESPYFITFTAMPYSDNNGHSGIALLSAHVSLENIDEVYEGTGMCYFAARG